MSETFGALRDEHHMRTIFENFAREAHGIAHVLQSRDRAGAKSGAIHDDGIAFDAAIQIQVRAVAGVEHRIIFQDHDGSFDSIESGSTRFENAPASGQRSLAARFAGGNRGIGNIPGAAVND